MGAIRYRLLLTVCCAAALGAACSTTVDGDATPSASDIPTRTSVPATSAPHTTTSAPPTTTSAVPAAQVADYMGSNTGSYYFTSPSSKFECAVITAPEPVAGCHGALPANAPQAPRPGGSGLVPPNAVRVVASSPGEFVSTGDPAFHRFDGTAKALPYGSPLRVQGFTCTVDEQSGVTCASAAGHGFTVSDSAYRLW